MATGHKKPRIVAGEAGGRRLVVPPGERVRPTSDRVKESVFSALGPGRLVGVRVLDLYAGSGAIACGFPTPANDSVTVPGSFASSATS